MHSTLYVYMLGRLTGHLADQLIWLCTKIDLNQKLVRERRRLSLRIIKGKAKNPANARSSMNDDFMFHLEY